MLRFVFAHTVHVCPDSIMVDVHNVQDQHSNHRSTVPYFSSYLSVTSSLYHWKKLCLFDVGRNSVGRLILEIILRVMQKLKVGVLATMKIQFIGRSVLKVEVSANAAVTRVEYIQHSHNFWPITRFCNDSTPSAGATGTTST